MRRIVIRGSISYFDQKSSRFADEKRQEVVGSNQVRINGEAQYPEAVVQVVLPYGLVPIIWSPFQQFAAPDVVYEHIDVAVVFLNLLCQRFHLGGFEMINCGRDPRAAESGDKLGRLFDCFRAVVFGASRSRTAARANHRCPGFAQGSSDAAPGSPRRSRNDAHAPA